MISIYHIPPPFFIHVYIHELKLLDQFLEEMTTAVLLKFYRELIAQCG